MPATFSAGTCLACGFVNASKEGATRRKCEGCGASVTLTFVSGEVNGAIPCDGACQYAVGKWCSCSCGGANHRRGYIAPTVPIWVRERDTQRHAAKVARKTVKAEKAKQETDNRREELLADYPILQALMSDEYLHAFGFMSDMRGALMRGSMSPRQLTATIGALQRDQRQAAREAQWEAEKAALKASGVTVPTGRVEVTGTIISAKSELDPYSYHGGLVIKIIVKTDDGWRVYGTAPKSLETDFKPGNYQGEWEDRYTDWLKGKRVTMIATLKGPSKPDDATFGYYSRPSKARVL